MFAKSHLLLGLGIFLTGLERGCATQPQGILPKGVEEAAQRVMGMPHIPISQHSTYKANAETTVSTQNGTINLPLLKLAFPEILGTENQKGLWGIPTGLESVPIVALQWLIDLACYCNEDGCECPPNLTKLKSFLNFQQELDSQPKEHEPEGRTTPSAEEEASEPKNDKDPGAEIGGGPKGTNQYGTIPQSITHSEVAVVEKVLQYLRDKVCTCFGPPPCCPPVMETRPDLDPRLLLCDVSCTGKHLLNRHPPCCPGG